jgi:hypothetical protein
MPEPAAPTPAADAAPARWVIDSVRDFDYTVGSVVRACFESYARVFHPAARGAHDRPEKVRWSEVAEAYGRVMHPAAEWGSLTGTWMQEDPARHPVWSEAPCTGELDAGVAASLAEVLAAHTTTPQRCWFAVWEGYGIAMQIPDAARFELPNRPMLLLQGPVEAAASPLDPPWNRSANLWWPDDHTWCVGSEIDLMTTYVGASAACVEAILECDDLEALGVSADQLVTWEADEINPLPGPPGTGSV